MSVSQIPSYVYNSLKFSFTDNTNSKSKQTTSTVEEQDDEISVIDLPITQNTNNLDKMTDNNKAKISDTQSEGSENVGLVACLEALQLQVDDLNKKISDQGLNKNAKKIYGNSFDRIPLPKFEGKTFYSILDGFQAKTIEIIYLPRVKFTGEGGMRVSEFLTFLTEAHDRCPVSEDDFKNILINKLQGRPMDLVNSWKRAKYSIQNIYRSLFETFSNAITSTEAREKLSNYSFPRHFKIAQILSELTMLADYAVQGGADTDQSQLLATIYVQDALQKSLPLAAYKLCYAQINEKRREINKEPMVSELVISILEKAPEIDLELTTSRHHKFGINRKLFSVLNKNNDKPDKIDRPTNPRPMIAAIAGSKSAQYNNKKFDKTKAASNRTTNRFNASKLNKYIPKKLQGRRDLRKNVYAKINNYKPNQESNGKSSGQNPRNNNLNAKSNSSKKVLKCSFCGALGHSASNGCWSIMDDQFKLFEGPISQVECSNCKDKLKLKLYHMVKFCPLRERMLKAYKEGLVTPRGIFRKWVSENNI